VRSSSSSITANHTLRYPRIKYDYYTTLERPLEIIATRFAELPEEYAYLKKLAADTAKALDGLDPGVFLRAYRGLRTFSPAELAAIPHLWVMFLIYGFGFYEDNFDDFSNTFLTPRFLSERIQFIRQWVEDPLLPASL